MINNKPELIQWVCYLNPERLQSSWRPSDKLIWSGGPGGLERQDSSAACWRSSFLSHPAGKAKLGRKSISAFDEARPPSRSLPESSRLELLHRSRLGFAALCVKRRVRRRSVAALEIKPLNLLYKSDLLALLRSVTMIIVSVFLFYCLGLSGKEDLIYMFKFNL